MTIPCLGSRRILKCNPPFPSLIGSVARDLLQRLLCKDPKKRLGSGPTGAQEIKEHPFFRVRPGFLLGSVAGLTSPIYHLDPRKSHHPFSLLAHFGSSWKELLASTCLYGGL